ncbi:MAG: YihY/virulence factor BrkB family protein [Draconibacterium sp.]|nr:YihY/virulence factor BrkB family protein [Draconibacterium sp.]
MDRYINHLIKLGEKIAERAKKISLPFFEGVPLYDVALFFWRSMDRGSITTRASAIAFSFFIAFFPFIIFLFTLIPFIPIENFQFELLILIQDVVPSSTYDTIESTVQDIIMQPRGDLLSFGFFAALIFSTNGLASMMSAFDATIHSIHRRTWISQRITAIYLLIILSVMLTIVIALLTSGQLFIQYLMDNQILRDRFVVFLLTFGKWILILALLFFTFSFLFYMAPAKKTKWRFISAGGTLSTLLSVLAIMGFTYYINKFNQYNTLYGSIGTLLIILLLMYVMSLILLLGFELNVSIHQAKKRKRRIVARET